MSALFTGLAQKREGRRRLTLARLSDLGLAADGSIVIRVEAVHASLSLLADTPRG